MNEKLPTFEQAVLEGRAIRAGATKRNTKQDVLAEQLGCSCDDCEAIRMEARKQKRRAVQAIVLITDHENRVG
jgi:hypothetical protein